jgi:hypothetical protein
MVVTVLTMPNFIESRCAFSQETLQWHLAGSQALLAQKSVFAQQTAAETALTGNFQIGRYRRLNKPFLQIQAVHKLVARDCLVRSPEIFCIFVLT